MTAMFFLFSNGSVLDLLLHRQGSKNVTKRKERDVVDELDEIKDGHAVPDGTQQGVAIGCEEHVALTVDSATDV